LKCRQPRAEKPTPTAVSRLTVSKGAIAIIFAIYGALRGPEIRTPHPLRINLIVVIYLGGYVKGISIKGIIIAILVALMADIIGGIVLGFTIAITMGPSAATLDNTAFLTGIIIVDILTTFLAGYVAASIAKVCYYKNAAVVGGISILIGIFIPNDFPLWFNVIGFLYAVPAALLGGHLAKLSGNKMPSATFKRDGLRGLS
jgi:hypothetical protein